jgi:hypothetical protein
MSVEVEVEAAPSTEPDPVAVKNKKKKKKLVAGAGEVCPEGMHCVRSVTDFDKSFAGQPNYVCCSLW